ncbi:MAG: hypothetical protein E7103_00620 [Prevotella sp.]|nr:hypothetical protein [Prevotella sp.]
MKKLILTCMVLAISMMAFGQAKKPTIMVVPSKTWCNDYGYMKTLTNNGSVEKVPDYERAFLENGDVKIAITCINDMMAEANFPLKDMEQFLSSLSLTRAENAAATSKSGGEVAESPMDIINARAKSDIIFDLYWKVNTLGPRRTLTYNLRALDAYSNKQVAAATGTGDPSISAELAVLLQEAVQGTMQSFQDKLQKHFEDMAANGREVGLVIRTWDNSPWDLEYEMGDKELNEVIEDWVADNTVNGRFTTLDATETRMEFDQVRIPLYNAQGRATDTRQWARGLVNFLKGKGIASKLEMRGLGHATITIGGK